MAFNNMMHAIVINYYKWVALISFLGGGKERKNTSKRKKKEKIRAFARPSLSSFPIQYSWVSRDVTSFAQVSVRHVGVPRVSNLC